MDVEMDIESQGISANQLVRDEVRDLAWTQDEY